MATQEKHPAPQAPHPIHPRKKAIISESPGRCPLPPSPNLFQIQGESEARAPAATPALTLHTAQHRSTRSTWQLIRWDLTSQPETSAPGQRGDAPKPLTGTKSQPRKLSARNRSQRQSLANVSVRLRHESGRGLFLSGSSQIMFPRVLGPTEVP